MSERPIQVGDLVCVVKPTNCCGNATAVGRHFVAVAVGPMRNVCVYCGAVADGPRATHEDGYGIKLNRLKRIPGPEELNLTSHDEQVTA